MTMDRGVVCGRRLAWSRISAFQAGDAGSNPADRTCLPLQASSVASYISAIAVIISVCSIILDALTL